MGIDSSGAESRPLLDWVLRKYPDTPKTRAKQWIVNGRVSVGGEILRKPHQMIENPGGALALREREALAIHCDPGWQIHPRVGLVYLDSAFAVVNKGAGLISVPAGDEQLSALAILSDFLAGRLKAKERDPRARSLPASYRRLQPLPVHRLDKYTTGLLCIALNPETRRKLIKQVSARSMKRDYIGFAEGQPTVTKGTWRDWVRLTKDEQHQRIVRNSETTAEQSETVEAITHFEVLRHYALAGRKQVTKLRLRLETGRKHQIRIQAANAGLPLIGDRIYNPNYRQGNPSGHGIEFERQALHADSLELEHPEQAGQWMRWTCELPKDLRQLEATLQALST